MFPIGEEKPCCNSIGTWPTSLIFRTSALRGKSGRSIIVICDWTHGRHRSAYFQQRALNLLATRLKKIRQLQVPTEGFDRLVDCEPGGIGRDLEENPTRLAEVDRTEIVA